MEYENMIEKIKEIKKGAYASIIYETRIPSNAKNKELEITKIIKSVIKIGCEYKNLKGAKLETAITTSLSETSTEVENSTRSKRTYEWIWYPYLFKENDTTKLRITVAQKLGYTAPRVLGYYANGVEISKEEAMAYTRPSAWKAKKEPLIVFDKNIGDIILLEQKHKG